MDGRRRTADGGRWTEDAETPCALRLKPKLPPSWPSCNPPKSWFRQSSKAPQGQTKPTTARRASRNKIPVNSLGLKIRATSCTSLNHANHSSDNAAMRSWQTKPTTTRRPEYNSGQQSRIENPSYILSILQPCKSCSDNAPTPQCLNPYIPPIYRRLLSIILLLKHIYTIRSLPHISEIHSAAPGKRFLIYTALNAAGVDALRASTPAAVKDHFFLQKVKR